MEPIIFSPTVEYLSESDSYGRMFLLQTQQLLFSDTSTFPS
jgi:hypothetical protein